MSTTDADAEIKQATDYQQILAEKDELIRKYKEEIESLEMELKETQDRLECFESDARSR